MEEDKYTIQIRKLAESVFELQKSLLIDEGISRCYCYVENAAYVNDECELIKEDIVDELTDCSIALIQIADSYGITVDKLNKEIKSKLKEIEESEKE